MEQKSRARQEADGATLAGNVLNLRLIVGASCLVLSYPPAGVSASCRARLAVAIFIN